MLEMQLRNWWVLLVQLLDDDILQDRVVFALNNFAAIKAIVHTEEKRNIVEKILDDAGFEHLITVRLITAKETFFWLI